MTYKIECINHKINFSRAIVYNSTYELFMQDSRILILHFSKAELDLIQLSLNTIYLDYGTPT